METSASNIGSEANGIDVVNFSFGLGSHDDLDELVLTGGDDELGQRGDGFV